MKINTNRYGHVKNNFDYIQITLITFATSILILKGTTFGAFGYTKKTSFHILRIHSIFRPGKTTMHAESKEQGFNRPILCLSLYYRYSRKKERQSMDHSSSFRLTCT